jgi:uncharacterized protein YjdB
MAGDDVMADKDIKWESSNPSVATVNNGYVSGISVGTTTIKATYLPTGLVATCEVAVSKDGSVTPEPTPGPGPQDPDPIVNPEVNFTLDANVKTVKVGKTNRILAKVDGKNAATKDLEFSVDKPEIATVNSMGVIKGVAEGKAKITVTYKPTGQTAVCQIAVEKDQETPVVVEGELAVDKKVVTLKEGETTKVVATVGGKTVDTKDLKFVSDKTDVAIVRNDGTILGRKAGKAKVTVTYVPTGKTAEVMVAVEAKETAPEVLEGELVLDQKVVTVEAGKTKKVTATINGKEVPRKDLKWTADKSEIVVVRNDGVILGVKEGKAKVTVTYVPTGKTADVMVAVTAQKEVLEGEISLDKSYVELQPKDVTKVTATINGKEIPSADYQWTTSDPKVATVKGGGILAVAPGKATITVTYKPTGKTASVEVVVKDEQAQQVDFTIDAAVKAVKVGKTTRITAKVDGKNANLADLEFTVDKPEVATVNNMGVITGVAAGKATVTVTYKPTGQTAVCQIAVEKDQDAPVVLEGEVAVDKKVVALKEGETTKVVATVGGKSVDTKDLKFVSDKTDVAIVRNDGTILGRKAGKAKVTVTYVPTGKTAEVMVAVEAKAEVLEGELALDQKVVELEAGKTTKVTATINGKEVPRTDLKWTADKSDIVVVRNDGVILGVKEGKAKVTVTYVPTGKTAEVMVAVKKAQETPVVVEGELALDKKVVTVKEGEASKVVATVGGKTVDKKDLKFVSDKTDVAIVRNDGTILGRKAGKAKVTVTYVPTGKTADVMVAVEAKETAPEVLEGELVLDQKVVAVEAGKTAKVTATINGKEVPRKDLKWTADKSDIAVVRNDGVILGVKEGKAKVTVTYVPTGKTAEVMVAVTAQKEVLAGEISLDKSYVELQPKDVTKVTATINGKAIPSADYKWTTSDSNVATVKGGGILAVAAGKATITVTYVPTGKTASVEVVVKDAQAQQVEFTLDANVKAVKVGKTNRILAKVDGKNAAIKDLEFSVDKPEVATVSNMGVITGVAAGKAKVTVTYKPTGQTTVCQIAVEKDQEAVATGITFDSKIKSVDVGKTTRVLVKVNGQNAKLDDLAFSVDQEQYATVNKMGVITGVKKGRCVVTVTYLPTGETAKLPVSVH